MKELDLAIGRTNFIEDLEVTITSLKKRIPISGKASHEAKHVVGAKHNGTGIRMATINPGPGYEGLTELTRPDPVAALAPHATGESGTSWDVYIAHQIGDAGAESKAAAIINAHQDEVIAVAQALEEKRTINGSDVEKAINNKDKEDVLISIKDREGNHQKLNAVADKGVVMLPGEWITLPKAA